MGDVADLRTETGSRILAAAAAVTVAAGTTDPLAAAAALARACPDTDPALRAAALTQVALRRHAAGRFGADAARMFFTRDGLEQATRPSVAGHRAASLRRRAGPDARTALDLCCGLGSELVALARAGFDVTGVDLDPEALDAAAANLAALDLPGRVVAADATTVDTSTAGVVVADPARRGSAGRIRDPERFSPPWSWVRELLARPGIRACVTTTPALAHRDVPAGCEAEWVDDAGSTLELAVWSPALSDPGVRRRATVLTPLDRPADPGLPGDGSPVRAGFLTLTDADEGADLVPAVADPEPGQWLLEPSGSVLRAGVLGVLAHRVDGRVPGPGIGYLLTADPAPAAGLASCFEILEVLPLRPAVLRRRLAKLGAASVEILARGVQVDVPALRARIISPGSGHAPVTLVLTRTRDGARALVVRRAVELRTTPPRTGQAPAHADPPRQP